MQYEEIPNLTVSEVEMAIQNNNPESLRVVPISVSFYATNLRWAEQICLHLSKHPNNNVRGNAILGLGHLARRFGTLTQVLVQPVLEQALQASNVFIRGQAEAAAGDIELFLKWKLKRPKH